MWMMIFGIILWVDAHFIGRVAPSFRARLDDKFGAKKAKGIFALVILLSVVLMVLGYRAWETSTMLYASSPSLRPMTAILAWAGFILAGVPNSKSRLRGRMRHPMLLGFALLMGSHLLVRGDVASVVLFGSLCVWAIASMLLINASEGEWKRKATPNLSLAGDIRLVLIGTIITAVAVSIHIFVFGLFS